MSTIFVRRFVIPSFLAAVCLLSACYFVLRYEWRQEMNQPAGLSETVYFVVKPGDSLRNVTEDLYRHELIRQPWFFIFTAWWEDRESAIQSGEYAFAPDITPSAVLRKLVEGDVHQHGITLIEGWSFAQVLRALRTQPAIRPSRDETGQRLNGEQIMERLGEPDVHPEGAFYPDTYHFSYGANELDILRRARDKARRVLAGEWSTRAAGLPYNDPYEALIMASLIEKEAQLDSERRRIAGVFVRRLQRGMRLQSDPTVLYAYGEDFTGPLLRRHMRIDSPYNTYARHGLPPTPICLTAQRSIRAAMQPEEGKALYFVALGDGSHHFSDNLREHNAMRVRVKKRQ